MINLENKKIIITGAASGIGKATALLCVKSGADVIAVDVNKMALEDLCREIVSKNICTYIADVSKHDEVDRVFEAIESNTPYPYALVNNAGIYYGKSVLKYTEEEIDKVISVNIKSAIYFSRKFAQYKLKNKEKGCIVNMSSVSGLEGSSDAIYGLTKAALVGLTKSNAINFSPYIRVNAVAPGIVDTPMLGTIPGYRIKKYREHELIEEPIKPEDVANTVAFLLSTAAEHYTGAVFDINNGCFMG